MYYYQMNKPIDELKFNEPYAGFEQDGEIYLWSVKNLWEQSANLEIFDYEIAQFNGYDKDVWFGNHESPTLLNILKHYKKIENANFDKPIIISNNGTVLDGVHRICKAYLEGRKTIPAVKFENDPTPDKIIKASPR